MTEIVVFFSILLVEFPTYGWNQRVFLTHKTKKTNKIEKNMPILAVGWEN